MLKGEKKLVPINDDELVLIDEIQNHLKYLCEVLKKIDDEKAWTRIRDYVNQKDYINLPYSSPFINDEKTK